jgi:hypothetical protein
MEESCMSLRKALFGLFAILMMGTALATPPENPLVEGREPNPVVREFYLEEAAPFEYGGGSAAAASEPTESGSLMWNMMMDRLTMPLGTAPMGV